jgi:hypothetical protein
MSRIPAVAPENAGVLGRLMYRFAAKRYGAMLDPMAVATHHRGVLFASCVHELMVERAAKSLPKSVRELAVYRAVVRLGCESRIFL